MLTYNRASYIEKAIQSALDQTYTNFELIILDDGSTDNTEEVVRRFTDPRIRYKKDTVNKGLYERRRESLSHVTGTYMAILDSDDLWIDPTKLAQQVSYLETYPGCAVVGTWITIIDQQGNTIGQGEYETTDATIRRSILRRNQFANSSVLMRVKALHHTNGYQPYAPAEDLELFLQLGQIGLFANLPIRTLAYRVHPGGQTAKRVKHIQNILEVIKQHRTRYPGALLALTKYRLYLLFLKGKNLLTSK